MASDPANPQPRVPGIDTDELLERIGGDLDLFWELLADLSRSYRDAPEHIAAALARDLSEGKRLTHSLKGVLGNLSAAELYPLSRALDEAVGRGERERMLELVERLGRELPALCDAIDAARAAKPVAGPDSNAHACAEGSAPPGASRTAAPPQDPASDTGRAPDAAWLAGRRAALAEALAGHRAREVRDLAAEIAAALPALAAAGALGEGEGERLDGVRSLARAYRFDEARALLDRRADG